MIELKDHQRSFLRLEQRHRRNKKHYVKITTILMLDSGFSAEATATALGIDQATLYRYVKLYERSASLEEYLQVHYQGSDPLLNDEQIEILLEELTTTLYCRSGDVARFITERFGLHYSQRGVRHLLKRLGFSYKKTSGVPAKADAQQQHHFLHRRLKPLLKRARKRDEPVYFCDAVHPQYNTRANYGWIATAEEWSVPTTGSRKRINLHGALNAHDPSDIVVIESDRVNTASTIALFERLQEQHQEGRIHVICDNATYYHSRDLRSWIKKNKSRIKITYLPPHSPNLNLIERLWKYLRREVLDTTYYDHYKAFTQAIFTFFTNINDHLHKLQALLSLNFHIYEFFAN